VKPVLLDTGVIVALLDSTDDYHRACIEIVGDITAPLITCETVIAESCHLLRSIKGAAESILHSVHTREFGIPISLSEAAADVSRLMKKYSDAYIDLADAFLIHLANEFETDEILTVDRDFQFFRWGRNNPFQMLVPLRRS
jgi:uncharacterized protein